MKENTKPNSLYKKGDGLITKEGYSRCICADDEIAIFAKSNKTGTRIDYTKLYVISNIDTSKGLPKTVK